MEFTDEQLLERFSASREDTVFAAILKRHSPMVLGTCRRILANEHDAQDAFQAVFILLAQKAATMRRESLGGWLYRVAYTASLKVKAKSHKRAQQEEEVVTMQNIHDSPNPDWERLKPVLDEELNRLPEKYRIPLVACYLEGKSYQAAADELGWNYDRMRGLLERGRELLRKRLVRRSVTLSSASALSVLMSQNASAAVPEALLQATLQNSLLLTGTAVAGGTVAHPLFSLTQTIIQEMFMQKVRIVIITGIIVASLGSSVYFGIGEYRLQQKLQTEQQNQSALQARLESKTTDLIKELDALKTQNKGLRSDLARLRKKPDSSLELNSLSAENENLKKQIDADVVAVCPENPEEFGKALGAMARRQYEFVKKFPDGKATDDHPEEEFLKMQGQILTDIATLTGGFGSFNSGDKIKNLSNFFVPTYSTLLETALDLDPVQISSVKPILEKWETEVEQLGKEPDKNSPGFKNWEKSYKSIETTAKNQIRQTLSKDQQERFDVVTGAKKIDNCFSFTITPHAE